MNTESTGRRRWSRRGAVTALGLLVGLAVGMPSLTPTATSQEPVSTATFSGYAHGTAFHTSDLQSGTTRVLDVEVATSGAYTDTAGITAEIKNEMERVVIPAPGAGQITGGKNSYGRGTGFEAGVVHAPSADNQLVLAGEAEASALPPTTNPASSTPGEVTVERNVAVDPAAYASLVRGQAAARWDPSNCILGSDMSYGLGYVADVQLIDTGGNTKQPRFDTPVAALDAPTPERAASQSVSRNRLAPQTAKGSTQALSGFYGLISETRQTIAPLTLFRGGANQTTIEVLGEWALQAVAGGTAESSYVHYGPAGVSPETPILRVLDKDGKVTNQVTLQQLAPFGAAGLVLNVPGVAEIAIGEDPRALDPKGRTDAASQPTVTATRVAAAVDVARVKVLEQRNAVGDVTTKAADIRLGHMEVAANVPAGGIVCPGITVSKAANPTRITAGESFEWTIDVTNNSTCVLQNVTVTDVITVPDVVIWEFVSSDPPAKGGLVKSGPTWELGSLNPGETKRITIRVSTDAASGGGTFVETATATGACGIAGAGAGAQVLVPASGVASVNAPSVTAVEAARSLPATGLDDGVTLGGFAALAAASALISLRRRALRTN